ncbi:MAG: hypothetical protein ACO3FA_09785 [Vulcanococcus sp.]
MSNAQRSSRSVTVVRTYCTCADAAAVHFRNPSAMIPAHQPDVMAIPPGSALTAPGSPNLSLQVSSVDDLARLARVFAASGLFGRNGNQETQIAECAIRLMAGMEAGFSPFASATGVHIINGRPAFSSNLLAQAVRRHPVYDYRVLEKTSDSCRIQFLANGQPLGIEEFTLAMAERAGLLKNPTWRAYPEAMLFSRALTAGMRTHCPDALGGHPAYTPEELGADAEVTPVTVTEQPASPPLLTTTEELTAGAERACRARGLTDHGIAALVAEISGGNCEALEELPHNMLARLAKSGVSQETVLRCNAVRPEPDPDPADDPDDLPAAWSA